MSENSTKISQKNKNQNENKKSSKIKRKQKENSTKIWSCRTNCVHL